MLTIKRTVLGLMMFQAVAFGQNSGEHKSILNSLSSNYKRDSVREVDQNADNSQLFAVLRTEFQKRNPIISTIELFDIRPLFLSPLSNPNKPNHYLVVAKGVRADLNPNGKLDDELFGLFIFDDSLFSIQRTLDFIPTVSWGDFSVKVAKIWKDSVTVQGVDLQNGDMNFFRRYYLLK